MTICDLRWINGLLYRISNKMSSNIITRRCKRKLAIALDTVMYYGTDNSNNHVNHSHSMQSTEA